MSFVLAITTVSVAAALHVAMTAPTPSVPKQRRLVGDYPGISYIALLILKYDCWLHAVVECYTSIAPSASNHLPGWQAANPPELTLKRAVGGILVIFGSTVRYLCYREMGRQYTYHVALLKSHFLVTTGPYSVVRHPGYTSGSLTLIGILVWHAARGSWLRESGIYKSPLAWLVIIPALASVASTLWIYMRRLDFEDELLKKEFGKDWEEWTKVVRYRLVPAVY